MCRTYIYTQMFIEILNVINKSISFGRYWSKWVDKVWDENCEHAINLSCSFELIDINQSIFII